MGYIQLMFAHILCFKINSHLLQLFKWMFRCCFAVKLQQCFVYYENSPEFPSAWVWAHNDRIHIFGWTVPIRTRDRLNFSGLWTMTDKMEKKQYLFLHQGITIGHWFQPLNKHPSKNKLKPSCLLSQFFQRLSLKETLWKSYKPKKECTATVPAHFQCRNTTFSDWIRLWFLAADRYEVEVMCLSAVPDPSGNSSSPHKYHNMWNCSGSTVQLQTRVVICVLGLNNINI